jgi:hypothetical protein
MAAAPLSGQGWIPLQRKNVMAVNGFSGSLSQSDQESGSGPVFVLSMARSGSTLLRLILDAHPMLACPPETGMPGLCAQLTIMWSLIEGAPLSSTPGNAPPVVPDAAIQGVRSTMDSIIRSYLSRRGKQFFCDKTLGAARYAELLLRIYPRAKFLCLYRHPMDVIMSGIEASPWGLQDYGFGPYASSSPDNTVFALARYWTENAAAILDFEARYPEVCHRVRYEDLVSSPDEVTTEIFEFLGVPDMPGLPQKCFTTQHERLGPSDYKIWNTSRISSASVGRGAAVPVALIPPPVLETMNGMLGPLSYVCIDGVWGTPAAPADPRRLDRRGNLVTDRPVAADRAASGGAAASAASLMIGARLDAAMTRLGAAFSDKWWPCGTESFDIVSQPRTASAGGDCARWRIDLAAQSLSVMPADDDSAYDWCIVGSPDTWTSVLSGDLNLSVALRQCDIRYCVSRDDGSLFTDRRIGIIGDVLGLSSWQTPPADGQRSRQVTLEPRS